MLVCVLCVCVIRVLVYVCQYNMARRERRTEEIEEDDRSGAALCYSILRSTGFAAFLCVWMMLCAEGGLFFV